MTELLPCYQLVSSGDAAGRVRRIAREIFEFLDFDVSHDPHRDVYTARETGTSREVELDERLGTIWMADWKQLWNPSCLPHLPTKEEAAAKAMDFLCKHDLLPSQNALPELEIVINPPLSTNTVRTAPDGDGLIKLDAHVGVPVTIKLDGHEIGRLVGRDKWCITFGDGGDIINCVLGRLVMRPQVSPEHSEVLQPPALSPESDGGALAAVPFSLGYERIRDAEGREWLLPMYFRLSDSNSRPSHERFPATARSASVLEGLIDRARGSLRRPPPSDQTLASIRKCLPGDRLFAATWTIDASEPKSLRLVQTQGLIDGLETHGWHSEVFLEGAALEEHWSANRHGFVQQVDFAYHCGHASQNFWMLTDGELNTDEVNDAMNPVQFGNPFVKWIAIAACGPLQDPATRKAASPAIPRWRNMFDGLLGFCGFASTSVPHQDMGEVLARGLAERPVPKAWFRAGRECQPLEFSQHNTDGFTVWMASLTCDDDTPTFDLSIDQSRRTPRRGPPTKVMAMWTPA